MTVVVVATVTPSPEHREDVIALFEATIARVHAEDAGCELYALHSDADTLVMIEKWSDAAALDAHRTSPAMDEMNAEVEGKLSARTVVKMYTPHPAGDGALGAL